MTRFVLPLALVLLPLLGGRLQAEPGGTELAAFVDELRAEASRLRGLEWKEEIPVAALTREELRENFIAMVERDSTPEELARDTAILRRLGMLAEDEDPLQLSLLMLENMVEGYFDTDTKKLYLVKGMTGTAQKPVILHELIHALEDQYIDLESRLEPFEEDSDRLFAEQCLIEGSAEHARERYQELHPDVAEAFLAEQADPEARQRQMGVFKKVPAYLILPTMLHYQYGPRLVTRSVDGSYVEGMARLYAEGPVSQEQFLHPARWFGEMQDYPQRVVWGGDFEEAAGEGWSKLHEFAYGELDLALYLDYFLGYTKGKVNPLLMAQGLVVVPRAKAAAAGWDGAKSYFLRHTDGRIAWIDAMVFDTEDDATEAREAVADVLKRAHGDAYVESSASKDQVDYVGRHGPGRLLQKGTSVLLVDGAPSGLLDRVWEAVVATTFERDPRDTWDAAKLDELLAACDWSDRAKGVGVNLPDEAWEVRATRGAPGTVARLDKGRLSARLAVLDLPVALVRPSLERQLRASAPAVDVEDPAVVDVAGVEGVRFAAATFLLYLAEVDGRTVILRAEGPVARIAETAQEFDRVAAGIVLLGE